MWEGEGGEEACSPRGPYSEVTYYRVGAMALGRGPYQGTPHFFLLWLRVLVLPQPGPKH